MIRLTIVTRCTETRSRRSPLLVVRRTGTGLALDGPIILLIYDLFPILATGLIGKMAEDVGAKYTGKTT